MFVNAFVYHVHAKVLRIHGDFRDGQNPPSNLTTPSAPVFTLVKPLWQRTVLVLDVSGSMGDNDRIGRLAQVRRDGVHMVNHPSYLHVLLFVPNKPYCFCGR